MGIIRKKTGSRGTDGGLKYVCDVCSADITSTVRIRCANSACHEYDLCVPCFAEGKTSREHDPKTHNYQVVEQHSIPIFTEDWGADEELALLEGAETYGLGSWADIADHIGGYREKDEVRDHYIDTYLNSKLFPLPERAPIDNKELTERIPREEFQARKKRRIEDKKEAAKNALPATPKQKPTASVPSCHEVQGYMPGRMEFETEYFNEAEEAVQHMTFDPGDGYVDDPNNPGQKILEPEMMLKVKIMDIYNARLTQRVERKKIIFEHKLLEYKKYQMNVKKRTKEENDLANKAKPFARMMQKKDFDDVNTGLLYEHNLRQAISHLQEWRQNGITDLKSGEKYETEKHQRLTRPPPVSQFDRLASSRAAKPVPPVETAEAATKLTSPDLPLRPYKDLMTITTANGGPYDPHQSNGTNGVLTPQNANAKQAKFDPLPGTVALDFTGKNRPADLNIISADERAICSALRLQPKAYIAIKKEILDEALKLGGSMKRKNLKEIARIDGQKAGRLWDFFANNGWISK